MAEGVWDPEFAEVVTALDATVAARGEGGASVCVYHRGRPVVDVWTGHRDEATTPWTADTLVMAFSTTKGITSTLLHQYVDRGLLDYDDPVADHWPEFAANGKDAITVRQVLCHRAGLYDLNGVASNALDLLDWDRMVAGVPAANGCFTARSLARVYAALAAGGELDGTRILSATTLGRATEVQTEEPDLVLALPMGWRLGYHAVLTTAGLLERGFGHQGLGGSGAFADPEREVAVAYLPNALGSMLAGDLRLLEIGGAAVRAAEAA